MHQKPMPNLSHAKAEKGPSINHPSLQKKTVRITKQLFNIVLDFLFGRSPCFSPSVNVDTSPGPNLSRWRAGQPMFKGSDRDAV